MHSDLIVFTQSQMVLHSNLRVHAQRQTCILNRQICTLRGKCVQREQQIQV